MNIDIKKYWFVYLLLLIVAMEAINSNYVTLLLFVVVLFKKDFSFPYSSKSFLWIVVFSSFYLVFAGSTLSLTTIPTFLTSYIIGYSLTKNKDSVFVLLFIIAIGTAIHGALNYIYFFDSGGIDELGNRVHNDFFTREIRGGTSQAISFLLYSALIATLIKKSRNWLFVLMIVLGFMVALYNTVFTASRSAFIYPILLCVISFFTISKSNLIKQSIVTLVLCSIIVVLFQSDFMGLKSYSEQQVIYSRFVEKADGGIIKNSRLDIQKRFFDNMGKYVLGGKGRETNPNYMHNVFLDTYNFAGVFTALSLIIVIIITIKKIWYIYRRVDYQERSYIASVFFAFFIPFNTEPIIQASPWFFSLFVMYVGIVDRRQLLLKQEIKLRAMCSSSKDLIIS